MAANFFFRPPSNVVMLSWALVCGCGGHAELAAAPGDAAVMSDAVGGGDSTAADVDLDGARHDVVQEGPTQDAPDTIDTVGCEGIALLHSAAPTKLVWLTTSAGDIFGIDATEVTRAQYCTWLASSPPMNNQPSYCSWNESFGMDPVCFEFRFPYHPPACKEDCSKFWHCDDCDDHPQTCIDWCDAYAYCRAVGKRLCGRIGGGHEHFDGANEDDLPTPTSQWWVACSSDGQFTMQPGLDLTWETCNCCVPFSDPVGSSPECQSPDPAFAGIFDLSCNAAEWEDACEKYDSGDDLCKPRAGGLFAGPYCTPYQAARCGSYVGFPRSETDPEIGFRCCSDP